MSGVTTVVNEMFDVNEYDPIKNAHTLCMGILITWLLQKDCKLNERNWQSKKTFKVTFNGQTLYFSALKSADGGSDFILRADAFPRSPRALSFTNKEKFSLYELFFNNKRSALCWELMPHLHHIEVQWYKNILHHLNVGTRPKDIFEPSSDSESDSEEDF
ncbi:uncharacterized protein LOC135843541 [Planococcus citri]|uniref:uncharacterized protein LOC135843541 n=1 Tax=Planococcus citri TaxID=170843 RepID=UPI0031F9F1B0